MKPNAIYIQRLLDRFIEGPLRDVFDLLVAGLCWNLQETAYQPVKMVAHRGLYRHPLILENSLAAFDMAVQKGAALEMDLHLTDDDRVVIHHDVNLMRLYKRPDKIESLKLRDLKSLSPPLLELDEVLERYCHHDAGYFLEIKTQSDDVRTKKMLAVVGKELDNRGLRDKAVLISQNRGVMRMIRHLLPEFTRAIVFMFNPREALLYLDEDPNAGLFGWYATYPKNQLDRLKECGLPTGGGFTSFHRVAAKLGAVGFEYVFTDRIDRF